MSTSPDHILPAVNRIDALFKEGDLMNYYLSLQIGEKSFSYCILDSVTNKYIGVGEIRLPTAKGGEEEVVSLPFEPFLVKVSAALPVLRKKFKACKVIWEGGIYTQVPESLFAEQERQRILSFNAPLDPQDEVLFDRIADLGAVTVYSIPGKIREVIRRTFGVEHLPHLISVLIKSVYQGYRAELQRPRVFLHVRDDRFDLLVMDHLKLYFANTFEYQRDEDLVYFTLFALQQLGMNQDQAEIVLMGRIARNTPLFNLVFKYLRRIEFARRMPGSEYSFVFNEIPPQAYFPLLNLNQCGL